MGALVALADEVLGVARLEVLAAWRLDIDQRGVAGPDGGIVAARGDGAGAVLLGELRGVSARDRGGVGGHGWFSSTG